MKCSWERSNFFLEQRLWTRRTNKDQSTNRVACSACLDKLWRMCRIRHCTRFVHDVSCASHHSIHRWISHAWCFSANLSRFEKIPIHLQSEKEKEGQTHRICPAKPKIKSAGKGLQTAWFFRTCLWMKRSTATKQIKLFEKWTEAIAKMWMLLARVKELKLLNILTHFLFVIDVPFSSEHILVCDQTFFFRG